MFNHEPSERDLYLNPLSQLSFLVNNPSYSEIWFIVKNYTPATGIIPLTSQVVVPYGEEILLYFGSDEPGSSTIESVPKASPSGKYFPGISILMFGSFNDTRPYAQTSAFAATNIEDVAQIQSFSKYSGNTGDVITVNTKDFTWGPITVGWVNEDGTIKNVTSTRTPDLTFTVPDAPADDYAVLVTDGIHNVYATFKHK
jgi:hypothetical protein